MSATVGNMREVSIYTDSDFGMGIRRVEGKLVEHGTMKYAQYQNAPYVTFIPKGKRKARQILRTFRPYLLILDGWDTPAPGSMWNPEPVSETPDATVMQSKYSSFDDRWDADCDSIIEQFGTAKIVADYRHTTGFRSE